MSVLKTGDQPPRGPNLLGKADMAAAPADGNRILSQLEHGAAAPAPLRVAHWRPGWWRWAAGGAGLAVLGAAVLSYDPASRSAPRSVSPATAAVPDAAAGAPAATTATALPATAEHAATIVNEAGPPLPQVAVAAAIAASAPRRALPPLRQAATRAPAARQASAAVGDSDVALLTAMVAHAHRQEGTAAPVRDVVLRQEDEETAGLLQRCKQLGLIEGMLCRSRICSGRWDSDPACH